MLGLTEPEFEYTDKPTFLVATKKCVEYLNYTTDRMSRVPTSIIIAISFFSGILFFTLGIIGIYLARIFEQTKGRDQYVIKEIKDY